MILCKPESRHKSILTSQSSHLVPSGLRQVRGLILTASVWRRRLWRWHWPGAYPSWTCVVLVFTWIVRALPVAPPTHNTTQNENRTDICQWMEGSDGLRGSMNCYEQWEESADVEDNTHTHTIKERQSPNELSVVSRYDVNCLTHYMVAHKSMKRLTISTRFLCYADRRISEGNRDYLATDS